tara:strand:- start:26 stop:607 length:582 start_codon:yes stop_codon:yes gene_type:complete
MTSKLKTDILETVSGSGTIALTNQLTGMTDASMPSGSVLQVVNFISTAKTSQSSSQTDTIVSDITKSITPLAANSKFLVNIRWFGEANTGWSIIFNIHMDGTRVNVNGGTAHYTGIASLSSTYHADDNDSTPNSANFSTLVTTSAPAGTALVFKLVASSGSSYTIWTNRCFGSAGADGYENSTSEIIITEIKG